MQHLDLEVINQALAWSKAGETIWLCTVLATFGSSPRQPSAIMVANKSGNYLGSLSGGCVEDDFIFRLKKDEFTCSVSVIRYGDEASENNPNISLPCGGILEVLIERLEPTDEVISHLVQFQQLLTEQNNYYRQINLKTAAVNFIPSAKQGPLVIHEDQQNKVKIRVSPIARLIIAGISPVAEYCANFAQMLGYEVIVCDHRKVICDNFTVDNVSVHTIFPADYIMKPENSHQQTAIVALTHDPRIDDLALMEAVTTPAFYIGVMGSVRSSENRAIRLKRSGGLNEQDIKRIHMPIGLALGSKTPAEIALAIMADITRVQRGKARQAL